MTVADPPAPAASAPPAPVPFPAVSRRSAWLRLGVLASAAAAAGAVATWVRLPSIPLCGMKIVTGYPCPGCGMTRSMLGLTHGDLAASFRAHPLGPVLAGAAAAVAAGAAAGLVLGRDPVWEFARRRATALALSFGVALVLVWAVRTLVVPEWAPDPIGPPVWRPR